LAAENVIGIISPRFKGIVLLGSYTMCHHGTAGPGDRKEVDGRALRSGIPDADGRPIFVHFRPWCVQRTVT
jgi:hypothetical protein